MHRLTPRILWPAILFCSVVPGAVGAQVIEGADWWSLQPLGEPTPPADWAAESTWGDNEIDAFIQRRLRGAGLVPSPEADRATLIRRLTYDLHGLPPTPSEIDAFVDDANPKAYDKLVDRLLASPRYGERWARHWLDIVHYGETHGFDKDKVRKHAWPYRDYVIRSFNADKNYARFVREQIAGDVMFPGDPDGIIATGFIVAGPWDYVGHTELREGTVDKQITRSLDRDDMVMNTMSTFVSTTVHCARCHDHKFDPIPQADYYRLQAVFAGVDRANRTYPDLAVARERQQLLSARASSVARRSAIRQDANAIRSPDIDAVDREIAEFRSSTEPTLEHGPRIEASEASGTLGYHSKIESSPVVTKWVQVDLGRSLRLDGILLVPAHVRYGGHPGPGFGFPLRFRVEVAADKEFTARVTLMDHTAHDFANPGDRPVVVEGRATTARFIRVTATKLWKRTGDWVFALSELVAFAEGQSVAVGAVVTSLDSIEAKPSWSRPNLTDGQSSRKRLRPASDLARECGRLFSLAVLHEQRRALVDALLAPSLRRERRAIEQKVGDIDRRLADLPPVKKVYAAATTFSAIGTFRPAGTPRPIHVLTRGEVKLPGEQVGAGALSALPGLGHYFVLGEGAAESDRRAALAGWITDPDNPLTWRSIVNRVWQYHFGLGLVRTPNDFGRMGTQPSHPELLDWLAARLRARGSIKELHRLMVMSATYRQTSANRARAAKVDAGNRLLWRMNRRRLEAECVRDAVLAVSGVLDLTMGGPSVRHFELKDDHSPHYDYTKFDVDSAASHRRSIYRLVVRSVPDPFLERLDCPDASLLTPVRYVTITAPQALALLNNRFMVRHSERFAAHLRHASATPRVQIEMAFRLALGRRPRADETASFLSLVRSTGLETACRTLFSTNEFLFVD